MNHAALEQIHSYIAENFLYTRPDHVLGPDDSLLDQGIIDSMGVMELVEFLQTDLGADVEDDEITEENLGTLRAIAEFVERKKALTPS